MSTDSRKAFKALPWYRQALQAADDVARMGANGLTLGAMDKFAGYMNGTGEAQERAKTAAAVDRAGLAGTAIKAVGAMGPTRLATLPQVSATQVAPAGNGVGAMLGRGAGIAADATGVHTAQTWGEGGNPLDGGMLGLFGGIATPPLPASEDETTKLIIRALLSGR